jgi:hypothetical protein
MASFPYDTRISEVFVSGKTYRGRTQTPLEGKLLNFCLSLYDGSREWVILDNYGNEILTESVTDRIFGEGSYAHGYYLAIDQEDGHIFRAVFGESDMDCSLNLDPLSMRVPPKYLAKLDKLMIEKRPFALNLPSVVWRDLFDHEIGFRDAAKELMVELHFGPNEIQIWGKSYRELSDWKQAQ